ncbi:MAG: ABC-2 family transporter protein [Planctomycetota bacterium]
MTPRLFLHVLSLEARQSMSYRVSFWTNALSILVIGFVIPYYLWQSIYRSNDQATIGGYRFEDMVLYTIIAALLGRVVRGPNLGLAVSNEIYQGELTKYCLYPTHLRLFKYAQHLGALMPHMVLLLLIGVPFIAWLGVGEHWSPWNLAAGAVLLALANGAYFLIGWPIHALAFWADNVWSLAVLLQLGTQLLGGVLLPIDLFPGWAFDALIWTPFPHLFYSPTKVLLGQATASEWAHAALVLAVWNVIIAWAGAWVWRRGEARYTGVGI